MSIAQLARKQFSMAGAHVGPPPMTTAAPTGSLAPQARVGIAALARAAYAGGPPAFTPVIKKESKVSFSLSLEEVARPAPERGVQTGSTMTREVKPPPRFSLAGEWLAGDGPVAMTAAEARGREPESGDDEKRIFRERAAAALVGMLPPYSLKCEGGKGSSMPQTGYVPAATRMVAGLGGTSAAKSNALRLFLRDWADWRSEFPPPFPISTADAVACRNSLRDDGQVTAADRVPTALEFAHELGLDVELDIGLFGEHRPRVQAPPPMAREAPPPAMVVAIAKAACDDASAMSPPMAAKAHETYLMLLGASRGGGLHDSKVVAYEDGVLDLVISEDKLGRKDVGQSIPTIDVRTGEPLDWVDGFADERVGLKFFISGWVKLTGKGGASVLTSQALARDPSGRLAFAPKRTALRGVTEAQTVLTEWTEAELKAANLSGTHLYRHLAGELTTKLQWPEPEGNVVGDWTTATKAEREAEAAAAAPRKRGRAGTRKRYYAPNATRDEQVRVRTRYVRAIAAGLQRFGVENITRETTWCDIFPHPPPEGLEWCYGADKGTPAATPPAATNEQGQMLLR
jgi:hypothetical protein